MVFKFAPPSITVYESETVEPEFADPKNVTEVDDSIDIIETDFNNIVQKFNRVILLIDDNADGEMPKIHIEPNEIEFDETVAESLKRLQGEFDELEQQFKKENQDLEIEHVESLRELLENAKQKLLVSTSANADFDAREIEDFGSSKRDQYVSADLSKMSERLSVISSAIGQPADPTKQFTQPLDFVVEELGLQLDAIPPNTSSSELKYALDEYGKQNRDENSHKINEIYETLSRWNTECQVLPLLVERLRHCGALSEQAKQLLDNTESILTSKETICKALNSLENSTAQTENVIAALGNISK